MSIQKWLAQTQLFWFTLREVLVLTLDNHSSLRLWLKTIKDSRPLLIQLEFLHQQYLEFLEHQRKLNQAKNTLRSDGLLHNSTEVYQLKLIVCTVQSLEVCIKS